MEARLRTPLLVLFALGLAVSITLAETVLAVLVIRWIVRLARGRVRPAARWPLGWPVLAFAAASLVAAVASPRPGESLLTAARGLALIPTFYVLIDALPDGAAARRFLGLLATLLAAVATLAIVQVTFCGALTPLAPYVGRVATKCHRAHGFYSIYMTLAGVLSLVLLARLPSLLSGGERASHARAPIVLWVLTAVGFALTYVRGAWVGFFAGVGMLLALLRRGRVVLGAGFLMLVIALLLVPGVRKRAESITDPADPTAYDRVLMWKSGAAMARDHWLLGVGPGQVKHVLPAYAQPEAKSKSRSHLHNTPLQIVVERGVAGLLTWAAIFGLFFAHCRRVLRGLAPGEDRRLVVGAVAAIAGFLVGGLTEYNFGDSEVALVAYTVMALPFAAASSGSSAQNVP